MNIEKALKPRSFILDLDRVKLLLGIFFFSELFNGEFFLLSGSTLVFVKNTPKAANLMFCLILPVAKVPWWFLGVQCRILKWRDLYLL